MTKRIKFYLKHQEKTNCDRNYAISMGRSLLDQKYETKFLGIILDSEVNFKIHIKLVANKLNLGCFIDS